MFKRIKGAAANPFTGAVSADWKAVILQHPEAFDCALYRPAVVQPPQMTGNILFGVVDERQEELTYEDPVLVVAVESTSEDMEFFATWDGDDSIGYGASQTMIVRLSEGNITEGSVIEFKVATGVDDATVSQFWYIHRSVAVGTPAIGFLHYCIPCGDTNPAPPAANQ